MHELAEGFSVANGKKNQDCNCSRERVQRKRYWKGGIEGVKRDHLASPGKSETNIQKLKSDEFWARWILVSLSLFLLPCLSQLVSLDYPGYNWVWKLLHQGSCFTSLSASSTHLYLPAEEETKWAASPCPSSAKGKHKETGGRDQLKKVSEKGFLFFLERRLKQTVVAGRTWPLEYS